MLHQEVTSQRFLLKKRHCSNFRTDAVKGKHQVSDLQEYDDKDQPYGARR